MQTLTLYKSSAGSGKTFTLVLSYLKLVLPEPASFRQVLAITFTNKATEEMKGRIIRDLAELSHTAPADLPQNKIYQLLRAYFDQQGRSDLNIQAQARETLNRILNDYTSFSVSTIESFFQRIVRAFARELNIPLGYEVEMERDQVLNRLVDELMLELGDKPALTRLLEGFVRRNLEEERSWNVEEQIKSLGGEIFAEHFQRQELEQPFEGDRLEETMALADEVWRIRRGFEQQMATYAQTALSIMAERNLGVEDFVYGKSGVGAYFGHVLEGRYEPGKRARLAYEYPAKWHKKNAPRQADIEAALDEGLMDALCDLLDLYDAEFRTYNTALQVSRTIYSFGLLGELQEKLADFRRRQSQMMISDTSFLLSSVVKDQYDSPFVYEKIGTHFQHYLLDEFQDTSDLQWDNLFPLVMEGLAQGTGSLIVGDAKQSIYRWRNGNLRLLTKRVEEMVKGAGFPVLEDRLTSNYRTAASIVSFNNALFQAAAKQLGDIHGAGEEQLFPLAYSQVAQTPQKVDIPGYVEMRFLPDRPGKDEADQRSWRERTLSATQEIIEGLIAEGFRGGEITLLVRRNQEGVLLANHLQQHQIPVVSAESLLVISHPHVRFLQAILQYLSQEQDEVAKAALAYYSAEVLHGQGSRHETFRQAGEPDFLATLEAQKASLRQLSVYECVAQLLQLLPASVSAPNAYVQGFLDAVLSYSSSQDASLSGFLNWWDDQKGKRAIAAAPDPDAVQIMTIHKAKGLEFPVVILPFVDWELGPKSNSVLWVTPQHEPYNRFPYLPVLTSSQLEESDFAEAYAREQLESGLDNLNLLYVAFTRPEFRLYAISKLHKKLDELKRISHLMQQMVQEGVGLSLEEETGAYIGGDKVDRAALRELLGETTKPAQLSTELQANPRRHRHWNERVRVRSLANRLLGDGRIEEGKLIHEALAEVKVQADMPMAVKRLVTRGLLLPQQEAKLVQRLKQVLTIPEVRDWYDGRWQVRNEADIILADGTLLRPDRVMIHNQRAIVVDYKTGQPDLSHHRQVRVYMQALQDLGYDPVEGWIYYLGHLQVERV